MLFIYYYYYYFNVELQQMDVITTFLNVRRKEHIFMGQPKGFIKHTTKNKVILLLKSIYGLKQTPRQ